MRRLIKIDGKEYDCDVSGSGGALYVTIDHTQFAVQVAMQEDAFAVTVDGRAMTVPLSREDAVRAAGGTPVTLAAGGREVTLECALPGKTARDDSAGHHHADPGTVVAMMPGTIVRILRSEGDVVPAGDVLLVLEAMKMENEIRSPAGGVVKEILAHVGKAVQKGEVLVHILVGQVRSH
jgi:biotin carboxyl carrier protein